MGVEQVNIPQISRVEITLVVGFMVMVGYILSIHADNMIKDNLIANLTANLSKLTTVQSFVDDYNEYSSICNRFQNDKADMFKKQCTNQGFEFSNYYVSYPSNDFLIVCRTPDGKAQVMRFR